MSSSSTSVVARPSVVPVTESFKSQISEWTALTDQKSTVMQDMKILNARVKVLKEQIVVYMSGNEIDVVNVKGGQVQMITNKTKEPLNRATLKSSIGAYLVSHDGEEDDAKAEELADFVLQNRGTKETRNLKLAGGRSPVSRVAESISSKLTGEEALEDYNNENGSRSGQ
jgi:hypothetical protein